MYLSNYKTDKQKRDHINRWFRKDYLFDLCVAGMLEGIESIKTKKELLENHLLEVWDLVCEEYEACCSCYCR